MPRDARFWRNVTIVAVAHIAILIALARWNREIRKTDLQSIVWMNPEVVAMNSTSRSEAAIEAPPPEISPARPQEQDESALQAPARSDLPLPILTPSSTPAVTPPPKRIVTPTPIPKTSAKRTPKPAPKKTEDSKATPKPLPKKRAVPAEKEKAKGETGKESAKVGPNHPDNPGEKSGSTEAGAVARPSEFSWYGRMLHDRFYREWIQPKTSVAVGAKMSALVRIRIERDGRISMFTIVRPSGNVVVDESVAAVAKRVTQVDPLPKGLGSGAFYEVNINFELSPE